MTRSAQFFRPLLPTAAGAGPLDSLEVQRCQSAALVKGVPGVGFAVSDRRQAADRLADGGVFGGSDGTLGHGDVTKQRGDQDQTSAVLRHAVGRAIAGPEVHLVSVLAQLLDEVPEDPRAADPRDVLHGDDFWHRALDQPANLIYEWPLGFLRRVDAAAVRGKWLTRSAPSEDADGAGGPHGRQFLDGEVTDVSPMEWRPNVPSVRIVTRTVEVHAGSYVDACILQPVREPSDAAEEIDGGDPDSSGGHAGTVVDHGAEAVSGGCATWAPSHGQNSADPTVLTHGWE
ncbi:Protein of unknown function [Micromonospora lupini str. Lupac 08]|uniref:Uncharacterized protein n=1 Tax=Micromonospora lupini str. Lupac 08 TaxID=1150864 RepID=I0KXG8_9ACTN|nr:Protein of unknown function [Micromonospora lupini str. Lupac 08]